MTFTLSYELDYKRIMSAVINDARNTIPATTNQPGAVIYAYIQAQIALVSAGVIIYRICTESANLGGYCGIQVQNGIIQLLFFQLRPAFQPFESEILQIIGTFIQDNVPLQDIIY